MYEKKNMKIVLSVIFLLVFYIKISESKIFFLNWYWGVEKIQKQDFFVMNFMPEIKFGDFQVQLELPVEVNSNWKARDNDWNGNEDIITKIKYFSYKKSYFLFEIKSLENISFQNSQMIYNYSNRLFETLLRKRGALLYFDYLPFSTRFMIDDIMDMDIFAGSIVYTRKKIDTGIGFFLDSDINDPYTDKPEDKDNVRRFYVNVNFNYTFGIKKIKIALENDMIRDFSENADSQNYLLALGPVFEFFHFKVKSKVVYYNKMKCAHTLVNYFYEIERNNIYTNSITKVGYIFGSSYNIKNFIEIYFGIEKAYKMPAYTLIELKTGDDFYTKFYTLIKIYQKNLHKIGELLSDRAEDSFINIEFIFPLSEHLNFSISYIKSFIYNEHNKLSSLRISMLKTEFRF